MQRTVGRPAKYNWQEWFTKQDWFILKRGVDYQCKTSALSGYIRRQATVQGYKATINTIENGIRVLITR